MSKSQLLYEGKAKKIYADSDNPDNVIMEFKDSLTAFNALKKGSFDQKGPVNRNIASLIFKYLKNKGVESHWIEDLGEREMRTKKVTIIPLEVVVRNILAGSTAKKLGIAEGKVLKQPLVEFYYKNDELQDPFLSDDQVLLLEVANTDDIKKLKEAALKVNQGLQELFLKIGIRLVDFKVEFGRDKTGKIVLADEITPDCCRLWDEKTGEKLDKDRFRRDLGNIKEAYEDVLARLQKIVGGNI